jgi:TolB-like protein/Tfp pilus assembly protein PilF
MSFLQELRRRKVFRLAALYIVGAWVVLQVADLAFESWDITSLALRYVWLGAILGFPVALIFGWRYDITTQGIVRTPPTDTGTQLDLSLRRSDYLILALIMVVAIAVIYPITIRISDSRAPHLEETTQQEIEPNSIAVLPFVNMSGELAQEYFSDGMSEELLHRLSQVSELHVAARTSSFYFKSKNISVADIAAQLGVHSVLEGSVRQAGNTIRVTAQLINASDGFHIWSKTYDHEFDDIFAIQDEIATQVVEALKVTLLGDEQVRLARHPTANLAAYDAYLLGRHKMARRTSIALQQAVEHFSAAIRLDPDYPQAYVGLADTYVLLERYGTMDRSEALANAEPAAEHALELDNDLGEALASLGTVRLLQQDFPAAEQAFRRALELNPNYAPAYDGYALLMRWGFADKEKALELHQVALELDPLSTAINMAVVEDYLELGRFEDALARCQRIIEIAPGFPRAYTIMADLYWEVFAQLDEGARWLHKAMELDPGNPDHARWLGMIYLDLGDQAAGEYWMREAIRLAPTQSASQWAAVYLASYTGEPDEIVAVAKAALAVSPRDGLAHSQLRDADYRASRGDTAIKRYREVFPDLVDGADPQVDGTNWGWAIEIANILAKVGERDRAEDLLNKALLAIGSRPRLGYAGFGISDVEIYALLGDKEKSLSTFATAVEKGWRASWWINTIANDNLASLHNDPRFQAIVADIQSQMAKQLARVREWEANGELVSIPKSLD